MSNNYKVYLNVVSSLDGKLRVSRDFNDAFICSDKVPDEVRECLRVVLYDNVSSPGYTVLTTAETILSQSIDVWSSIPNANYIYILDPDMSISVSQYRKLSNVFPLLIVLTQKWVSACEAIYSEDLAIKIITLTGDNSDDDDVFGFDSDDLDADATDSDDVFIDYSQLLSRICEAEDGKQLLVYSQSDFLNVELLRLKGFDCHVIIDYVPMFICDPEVPNVFNGQQLLDGGISLSPVIVDSSEAVHVSTSIARVIVDID